MSKAASSRLLPPLPGSAAAGVPSAVDAESAGARISRAGSYTADRFQKKTSAHHERVLFPTHVKESFLQRNAHMANAKMEAMAREFAQRSVM